MTLAYLLSISIPLALPARQEMTRGSRDDECRREFSIVIHDEWLLLGHLGRNWCLKTPQYAHRDRPHVWLHGRGDCIGAAQVRR